MRSFVAAVQEFAGGIDLGSSSEEGYVFDGGVTWRRMVFGQRQLRGYREFRAAKLIPWSVGLKVEDIRFA